MLLFCRKGYIPYNYIGSMSAAIPYMLIAIVIGVVIALGGGILVYRSRKASQESTNYRSLFNMGIVFFPVGVIITVYSLLSGGFIGIGLPFLILGVIYLAMGLSNRDKWNKKEDA